MKLYKMIIERSESVLVQRIVCLLPIDHYNKTAVMIKNWIAMNIRRYSKLAPYIQERRKEQKDAEWKLYINETMELDI